MQSSFIFGFEGLHDDDYDSAVPTFDRSTGVSSPINPSLPQQRQGMPIVQQHLKFSQNGNVDDHPEGKRRRCTYEEIEQTVEMRRRAEEVNLIDFSEPNCSDVTIENNEAANSSEASENDAPCTTEAWGTSNNRSWDVDSPSSVPPSTYREDKLPKRAIIYDYTVQPIGIIEHKRNYQSEVGKKLSYPFLRPVYIDGVGLIKAYRGCCSENNRLPNECLPGELHFPFMPIIRCLFYWISRGHRTVICFSKYFSPIDANIFRATEQDKVNLKLLEDHGMAQFFEAYDGYLSKKWFDEKREQMRACLVTTVPHYLQGMQHDLIHSLSEANFRRQDRALCPDRLLQPFYDHKGNTVFFSLFNNKNQCVDSIVLDDDIHSKEEFNAIDQHQLSFLEQALQLRILYDLLPDNARVREANVMVEVFTRLKPFL